MHGLLQTEDYARAVLSARLRGHSVEEIGRLVELRMKRQEALVRADPPAPELVAVVDEAVLLRAGSRSRDRARAPARSTAIRGVVAGRR